MATQINPVCGMKVDEEKAAGQSEYENRTYYFCASLKGISIRTLKSMSMSPGN